MQPVLFTIPMLDISVYSYGAFLVLGIMLGTALASHLGRRDGIAPHYTWLILLSSSACGLLGAKILMVVEVLTTGSTDLSKTLTSSSLRSGGVYYGGMLAAIAVASVLGRVLGLPNRLLMDSLAV